MTMRIVRFRDLRFGGSWSKLVSLISLSILRVLSGYSGLFPITMYYSSYRIGALTGIARRWGLGEPGTVKDPLRRGGRSSPDPENTRPVSSSAIFTHNNWLPAIVKVLKCT